MLRLTEVTEKECRTLTHSPEVFHKALQGVLRGESHFHVKNPLGKDYDLEFSFNNDILPKQGLAAGKMLFPPFYIYNEYDKEKLYLHIFDEYDDICFESLNEYSIVLAGIVLRYTDKHVYIPDERILWFTEKSDRLHITDDFPDRSSGKVFLCCDGIYIGYDKGDFSKLCAESLFLNVFVFQWLTDKPLSRIKYVEVTLSVIVGIGGVLAHLTRIANAFASMGMKTYLKPDSTRFGDEMIGKYFNIEMTPEDSTEDNTIYVANFTAFSTLHFLNQYSSDFNDDILNPGFMSEMEDYRKAVLGDKKVLGILARGTDYIAGNYGGTRRHAAVEEMLPTIHQWMAEENYDTIFLATEDQDILDKMKAAFPGKIRAIAQERHRVSDFKQGEVISEIEKRERSGQEYREALEDTTVNYFYALYILSRCDSFMVSGQCNGWDTVLSFNHGKFRRTLRFLIGVEGNPITKSWKTLRELGAGVWARAVYPEKKAFYMTFAMKLREKADIEAVRNAWNTTMQIYPYFTKAIIRRGSGYVVTENPLDFVIRETDEVIEPFEVSGNFHFVTICCSGERIVFYIDHVPCDGTAVLRILSTFMYYYYCRVDGKEYDVPEGVRTMKDGPAADEEVDAYLMEAPIDPQSLAAGRATDPEVFIPEDIAALKSPETFAEYGRYVISVDGSEFIGYARSVGGSPQSLLNQLMAQTLQRVHPDNTKPVKIGLPVSVRKVFGNENSLLHQVVHGSFIYDAALLRSDDNAADINVTFRNYMKGFASEKGLHMMAGVYHGMIEGFRKAIAADMMSFVYDSMIAKQPPSFMTSMMGTIKTDKAYGSRISIEAVSAMPSSGMMAETIEVGDKFYICWDQNGMDETYVNDVVRHMHELGMVSASCRKYEK